MKQRPDRIQDYTEFTKIYNLPVDSLAGSFVIVDFMNDFLNEKYIDKETITKDKFQEHFYRKYSARKAIFDRIGVSRMYVLETQHSQTQEECQEKRRGGKLTEYQKQEKIKMHQYLDKFLDAAIGILHAVQGEKSLLLSMYEADQQCAKVYRSVKEKEPHRKVYVLSRDGDCFFYQLPFITSLKLDINSPTFGQFHLVDIERYKRQRKRAHHTEEQRQILEIFKNRSKLALLKVLSGTKRLRRQPGVSLKKMLPVVSKLNFEESDIIKLKPILASIFQEQLFDLTAFEDQDYLKKAQKEVVRWLCALVQNHFEKQTEFLDNILADHLMKQNGYSLQTFYELYTGHPKKEKFFFMACNIQKFKHIDASLSKSMFYASHNKTKKDWRIIDCN